MDSLTADKIFFGGDIITMDENNPNPEALAVKDGNIIAVGGLEEIMRKHVCEKTTKVNIEQQTLMPGLIEPHQHAVGMVKNRCMFINISGYHYESYDETKVVMQKAIHNIHLSTHPDAWCRFFGWDPELVADLPVLTADFLDQEFSSEVPIFIWGQSAHVAWANHKALQAAGIYDDSEDPDEYVYVRDKDGKLTGQLMELPAIVKVLNSSPQPSDDEIFRAIQIQWKDLARRGFTTVTDLLYFESEDWNKALNNESKKEQCPIRIALYPIATIKHSDKETTAESMCCVVSDSDSTKDTKTNLEEHDKVWVQGFKIVADGSPHCGTMAVQEPFLRNNLTEILGFPEGSGSCGAQNYSLDVLYNTVKSYHDQGKQVAIHAHGERAIDRVISVFEKVLENDKCNSLRHRMEHLGLITEDQIVRAAKINLTFSFFVSHLYLYAKTYSESILGRERTNRWTPLSLATKHDIRWSLHQDHPAFPGSPQPFESMRTAITRTRRGDDETVYGPEYRVTIHEALKAYTINAAWQLNREKEIGSLEVGKKADLVILSDNPYKVDPFKLQDIKVFDTFIDGRRNKSTND